MNNIEANVLDAAANHLRGRDLTVAINKARGEEHADAGFVSQRTSSAWTMRSR